MMLPLIYIVAGWLTAVAVCLIYIVIPQPCIVVENYGVFAASADGHQACLSALGAKVRQTWIDPAEESVTTGHFE